MDIDSVLKFASECESRGDLAGAEEVYESLLQMNPKHSQALFMAGRLAYQQRNWPKARDLLERAVKASPKRPEYYHWLGLTFMEQEEYGTAEDNIRRAIRLSSRPEFHNSLGKLKHRQGHFGEAIRSYQHAIKQDSQCVEAYYNLGNSYRATGQVEKAVETFRRAAAADPRSPRLLSTLAETLRSLGRGQEAVACLKDAIGLAPRDCELTCTLGDVYHDLGDLSMAVAVYRRALDLNPQSARAWYALGCAELSEREYASAVTCFERALREEPTWLEAEHNLARALFQLGRVDEAVAHFKQCAGSESKPKAALARAMLAVIVPGAPAVDNGSILACRRSWVQTDLQRVTSGVVRHGRRTANQRLKIGYISSFFHRHNWMKPVWALISHHDRTIFEIHLFSGAPLSSFECGYDPDPRDHFHDIGHLSNGDVAHLIAEIGIDVLIDLNSYSDIRRLEVFQAKPAPVIAAWFNLYATSGLDSIDYVIGDAEVIPPAEECYYTERIRRVSGSYLTFDVNYPVPDVVDPPCETQASITFGSLASQIKITGAVIETWARILAGAPGATLIIKNGALGSAANREFVHSLFAKYGISQERIHLEGPSDHFEFLKTYDKIDIALDTFPYNGGTTTTEALWQGVPVVTYYGDRWVARTSASILRAGGLGMFVQHDVDGYVSFCVELAARTDTPAYLSALRRSMRSSLRSSAVCNTEKFTLEMEALYLEMHRAATMPAE